MWRLGELREKEANMTASKFGNSALILKSKSILSVMTSLTNVEQ
jgi:hypothetical protein